MTVQESIANLDLYVLHHNMFGKGDIKKMGFSPDGFIQMALQLAYFKVRPYMHISMHCAVLDIIHRPVLYYV